MKRLIIICAGGFGRETANTVERINTASHDPEWEILGFVDDDLSLKGTIVDGYPVLGTIDKLNDLEDCYIVCANGQAKYRKDIISRINNPHIHFATIIDPEARVFKKSEIGEGSIICCGSIVSINVKIEKHVIVNLNSTIGHDCICDDFSVINPGVNLSGAVHIKEACDLGTGAQVLQGLSIGPNTVVGAGAVVIRDIHENCMAVGVPAKVK